MTSYLASSSNVVNTYEYSVDSNLRLKTTCDGLGDKVNALSWNHTNQVIAAAGSNQRITLIQSSNGQFLSAIPFDQTVISDKISTLCFSGNSRYLASSAGHNIQLWDLKKRSLKTTLPGTTGDVTCLTLAPDGARCVSGDKGGALRLWDVKHGRYSDLKSPAAASEALFSPILAVDQPAAHLVSVPKAASGDGGGTLSVWDLATGTQISSNVIHSGGVASLGFSPKNGRLVATCGPDGRLCLMDIGAASGTPSASTELPGEHLTHVAFHENAIQCAIGTASGWLHVYDWRNTHQPLCSVHAHPGRRASALAFQRPQAPGSGPPSAAASTPAPPKRPPVDSPVPVQPSPLLSSSRGSTRKDKDSTKVKSPGRSPKRNARLEREREEAAAAAAAEVDVPGNMPTPPQVPSPKWTVQGTPVRQAMAEPESDSGVEPQPSSVASVMGTAHPADASPSAAASVSVLSVDGPGPSGVPDTLYSVDDASLPPRAEFTNPTYEASTPPRDQSSLYYQGVDAQRESPRTPLSRMGLAGDAVVTTRTFHEALGGLKYDVHREVQAVLREQVRQFALAKQDMERSVGRLSDQLQELLAANAQLRAENERLRKIY